MKKLVLAMSIVSVISFTANARPQLIGQIDNVPAHTENVLNPVTGKNFTHTFEEKVDYVGRPGYVTAVEKVERTDKAPSAVLRIRIGGDKIDSLLVKFSSAEDAATFQKALTDGKSQMELAYDRKDLLNHWDIWSESSYDLKFRSKQDGKFYSVQTMLDSFHSKKLAAAIAAKQVPYKDTLRGRVSRLLDEQTQDAADYGTLGQTPNHNR